MGGITTIVKKGERYEIQAFITLAGIVPKVTRRVQMLRPPRFQRMWLKSSLLWILLADLVILWVVLTHYWWIFLG